MNFKNILLSCVLIFGSLSLSGCYTQLSMFHPEVETDSEEFQLYSVARVRPNIRLHAQDGAGQSLSLAYQMMYNRFSGFMGFGNRYSYYNPYYYGGYYNDFITVGNGSYSVWIPVITEEKARTWTRDRSDNTPTTKLKVTRTRTNTSNRISDPYPVQDTPRQDTFNSQRSTSSSNSSNLGRVTRRN